MDQLTSAFKALNLEFNLIDSTRSGLKLLNDDDAFEYKISYKSKTNEKITWRCDSSEMPNCPGSVTTFAMKKTVVFNREHKHLPSIKSQVKKVMSDIKATSEKNPDSQPRKIIFEATKQILPEVIIIYNFKCKIFVINK